MCRASSSLLAEAQEEGQLTLPCGEWRGGSSSTMKYNKGRGKVLRLGPNVRLVHM